MLGESERGLIKSTQSLLQAGDGEGEKINALRVKVKFIDGPICESNKAPVKVQSLNAWPVVVPVYLCLPWTLESTWITHWSTRTVTQWQEPSALCNAYEVLSPSPFSLVSLCVLSYTQQIRWVTGDSFCQWISWLNSHHRNTNVSVLSYNPLAMTSLLLVTLLPPWPSRAQPSDTLHYFLPSFLADFLFRSWPTDPLSKSGSLPSSPL